MGEDEQLPDSATIRQYAQAEHSDLGPVVDALIGQIRRDGYLSDRNLDDLAGIAQVLGLDPDRALDLVGELAIELAMELARTVHMVIDRSSLFDRDLMSASDLARALTGVRVPRAIEAMSFELSAKLERLVGVSQIAGSSTFETLAALDRVAVVIYVLVADVVRDQDLGTPVDDTTFGEQNPSQAEDSGAADGSTEPPGVGSTEPPRSDGATGADDEEEVAPKPDDAAPDGTEPETPTSVADLVQLRAAEQPDPLAAAHLRAETELVLQRARFGLDELWFDHDDRLRRRVERDIRYLSEEFIDPDTSDSDAWLGHDLGRIISRLSRAVAAVDPSVPDRSREPLGQIADAAGLADPGEVTSSAERLVQLATSGNPSWYEPVVAGVARGLDAAREAFVRLLRWVRDQDPAFDRGRKAGYDFGAVGAAIGLAIGSPLYGGIVGAVIGTTLAWLATNWVPDNDEPESSEDS